MKNEIGSNMMLFTSFWGQADTFKMLPVTKDCPFVEVIYDPKTTLLVVIGVTEKENYQMVPKLDDDGEPQVAKKPRSNNSRFREQRAMLKTNQEYYITEKSEQEAFIKQFAINAKDFEFSKFLRDLEAESKLTKVEAAPLLDKNGLPLVPNKKKK